MFLTEYKYSVYMSKAKVVLGWG